jgi:hypothetical protein
VIADDWQFEIDDGVTTVQLGAGTPYRVYEFAHEKPEVQANATSRARQDGTNRGRDYLGATVASFEIGVDGGGSPSGVLDAVAALRAVWYGDNVRREPGARAILRAKRPGRDVVRMYGRPGAFKPASMHDVGTGYVPLVCEFEADDGYFYSDTEHTLSVPFIPSVLGGLIGPLEGPWVATAAGEASGRLEVGGECPAWLTWAPHGPITNPKIEVVGRWDATLQGAIAYDTQVVVDPSPWNRTARAASGANWAGKFKTGSTRMSRMQVPPGESQVLLRGVDPSGTSYLDLAWRSVYAAY